MLRFITFGTASQICLDGACDDPPHHRPGRSRVGPPDAPSTGTSHSRALPLRHDQHPGMLLFHSHNLDLQLFCDTPDDHPALSPAGNGQLYHFAHEHGSGVTQRSHGQGVVLRAPRRPRMDSGHDAPRSQRQGYVWSRSGIQGLVASFWMPYTVAFSIYFCMTFRDQSTMRYALTGTSE